MPLRCDREECRHFDWQKKCCELFERGTLWKKYGDFCVRVKEKKYGNGRKSRQG